MATHASGMNRGWALSFRQETLGARRYFEGTSYDANSFL
jgi:hypothetical protein